MRAQFIEEIGTAALSLRTCPQPIPGPGQVLVAVHASGVNPADLKIAAGHLGPAQPELPAILGMDFAGVIAAVGPDVDSFSVGDEVYGCGGGVEGRPGTLAEYVVVDDLLVAPKPKRLSMREAAALPLVAITAWEGLVDRVNVQAGDTVLVQSAAGGVGHVAVQIAVARGARVFATASTSEKIEIARRLGAEPIAYREVSVADYVARHTGGRGFDIVYDTVGGTTLEDSAAATRIYGQLISCAAWETHNVSCIISRSLTFVGISMLLPMLTGVGMRRHGEILREVASLVDTGHLRPLLDRRRFSLATAMDAHAHLASGQAIGKVVVDIIT